MTVKSVVMASSSSGGFGLGVRSPSPPRRRIPQHRDRVKSSVIDRPVQRLPTERPCAWRLAKFVMRIKTSLAQRSTRFVGTPWPGAPAMMIRLIAGSTCSRARELPWRRRRDVHPGVIIDGDACDPPPCARCGRRAAEFRHTARSEPGVIVVLSGGGFDKMNPKEVRQRMDQYHIADVNADPFVQTATAGAGLTFKLLPGQKDPHLHQSKWQDICAALNKLNPTTIVLVGHSNGGAAAMDLARCLQTQQRKVDLVFSADSVLTLNDIGDINIVPTNVRININTYVIPTPAWLLAPFPDREAKPAARRRPVRRDPERRPRLKPGRRLRASQCVLRSCGRRQDGERVQVSELPAGRDRGGAARRGAIRHRAVRPGAAPETGDQGKGAHRDGVNQSKEDAAAIAPFW